MAGAMGCDEGLTPHSWQRASRGGGAGDGDAPPGGGGCWHCILLARSGEQAGIIGAQKLPVSNQPWGQRGYRALGPRCPHPQAPINREG